MAQDPAVVIATLATGVSIILAFFDVVSWGTVGWIILGCFVYISLIGLSRASDRKKLEKEEEKQPVIIDTLLIIVKSFKSNTVDPNENLA